MRQRIWIELIKDDDPEIHYHSGEANCGSRCLKPLSLYPECNDQRETAGYVAKCNNCQRVKTKHQRPAGLLQTLLCSHQSVNPVTTMVDFSVTTGGREPCLLVRPVRNKQENDSLHPPLLVPTLLPPIVDGLSSRT